MVEYKFEWCAGGSTLPRIRIGFAHDKCPLCSSYLTLQFLRHSITESKDTELKITSLLCNLTVGQALCSMLSPPGRKFRNKEAAGFWNHFRQRQYLPRAPGFTLSRLFFLVEMGIF